MKELAELIAELARVAKDLEGGTNEGAFYTYAGWREQLEAVAKRADELAARSS